MGDVILRANVIIRERDQHGKVVTFHPGDWFGIKNRNRARMLIESGQATLPGAQEAQKAIVGELDDCGIVVRNGDPKMATHIRLKHPEISAISDGLELAFARTLLWTPSLPMTVARAVLGFCRIEDDSSYANWEAAAMLRGHNLLARGFGSKEDQAGTKALFGDLRLPIYETQAVWIRKTRRTEQFVESWREEVEGGCGDEHAFLRALFAHKIILCTLPQGWLARWAEDI
jgi:hypothetical protein